MSSNKTQKELVAKSSLKKPMISCYQPSNYLTLLEESNNSQIIENPIKMTK